MTIVHCQTVHQRKMEFCQPLRQHDIPDRLAPGMVLIAGVMDSRMPVVDLKELLADHMG